MAPEEPSSGRSHPRGALGRASRLVLVMSLALAGAVTLTVRPRPAAACSAFNPICWVESAVDTLKDVVVAVADLVEEVIELDPGDFFSDLKDISLDLIVCDGLPFGSEVAFGELILTLAGSNIAESLFNECSGSAPIDPTLLATLEAYYGSDFSSVRIHQDCDIDEFDVDRDAITFGEHIYFDTGEYVSYCTTFVCDGGTNANLACDPAADPAVACPSPNGEPTSCRPEPDCTGFEAPRCAEIAPGVFVEVESFALLAHELMHVLQYRKKGFDDFTCEWALECLIAGGDAAIECEIEQQAYVFHALVQEDMQRDGDGIFSCPLGECDGEGGVWDANRVTAHSCSAEVQLCGLTGGTPDAPDYCLASDNCPDVPNPDQLDSDGDGRGDACDVDCPGDPDPLPFEDLDADCVADAADNCPCPADFATALSDCDTSNDGSVCTGGSRAGLPCDTDEDVATACPGGGACDPVPPLECRRVISCVEAFGNPDQADCEGDGIGNECDDDDDNDSLLDADEETAGTDPCDPDSDDDDLTDYDEVAVLGTDPLDPDTDDDGLEDGDEVARGTDPLDADSDDDGLGDGDEIAHGTDPLDPDTDDDLLPDGVEVTTGLDPLDADSDDDGLPDGRDVEFLQNALASLPDGVFRDAGGGQRTALLSTLDAAERLLARGRTERAVALLAGLRGHLDGCGVAAERDDWIVACETQLEVRTLLDLLLGNLAAP